jgi:hypothetical protein
VRVIDNGISDVVPLLLKVFKSLFIMLVIVSMSCLVYYVVEL